MADINDIRETRRAGGGAALWFFLLFALVFIRYCAFGLEYYPQLDDYIQFHNYTAGGVDTLSEVAGAGLLGARPAAALGDIFVWSPFFPAMIAGVALICALYAASGLMLWRVWARHFGAGPIFLVLYALLPLGLEGVYWMSAATRVVPGLFFAAAALLLFDRWCLGGRKMVFAACAACQLLAFGFYEQMFIFSAASLMLLGLLNYREHRGRALWALWTLVNAAVYFAVTGLFPKHSVYESRMALMRPWGVDYWTISFPGVLTQLRRAFISGGFFTAFKGFWRGAALLIRQRNFWYPAGIAALCAALFFHARREGGAIKKPRSGLAVGLLLAIAPVSVFFLIVNSWFSLRATVASFCGLALMADILFSLIFGRRRGFQGARAAAAALLAAIFCIASVSEIHDYRQTTIKDRQVVALLAQTLSDNGHLRPGLRVGILNLEPSYLPEQNYFYHEHIHGVTESDWALHGALEWYAGPHIPDVVPLPRDPMYAPWCAEVRRLDTCDVLYFYDGAHRMTMVEAVTRADGVTDLYGPGGAYIGSTWEEDGYGRMALAPPYGTGAPREDTP